MRLGKDALVLTQAAKSRSITFLSQSLNEGKDAYRRQSYFGLGDGVDVFGSSYFNESIGISVGGVVLDGGWVFTLALASPMFGCSHWRNEAWKGCSCSYTGC
ncbi:uncharacterized protein [Euphorbia lathyris]|uniref:uncharacterized protein isoform X3 n=1 Tax=Euphorbia lathyris TaxID=212925 RepID=UPI003313F3E1